MPKGESADEYSDPGQDGIEKIEGAYRTHADEVEKCAFDTQVSERFVQALEHAVGSFANCFGVCHNAPHRESRFDEY